MNLSTLKKTQTVKAVAVMVIVFALSQFVVTTYMQSELWVLWWMGVVMPAYLVMVPLTIVQVVIAGRYVIAGGKRTLFGAAMTLVCVYALWSVYVSYTIFVG